MKDRSDGAPFGKCLGKRCTAATPLGMRCVHGKKLPLRRLPDTRLLTKDRPAFVSTAPAAA